MSKKLEKLKEVNMMLTNVLMDLETRIFIECIDDKFDRITKKEKSEIVCVIKQ